MPRDGTLIQSIKRLASLGACQQWKEKKQSCEITWPIPRPQAPHRQYHQETFSTLSLLISSRIMSRAMTTAKTSKKLYPRSTVKKIIQGHSDKNVGRDVDALVSTGRHSNASQLITWRPKVYIDYILFMQE
jgi:hypothetical protein